MMLINPYRYAVTASDFVTYVKSLLHFDGTNGSTTFTDQKALTWSLTGTGVTISTAQSKFGGASLTLGGSGHLSINNAALTLGAGDFTIEGWFRANNIATSFQSLVYRAGAALYITGSKLTWYQSGIQIQSSTLLSNTWYHFELSRASGVIRLFVDGTKAATDYSTAANFTSTPVFIGRNSTNTEPFAGFIDDLRHSVGIARHTTNFTPPTAAYPDS